MRPGRRRRNGKKTKKENMKKITGIEETVAKPKNRKEMHFPKKKRTKKKRKNQKRKERKKQTKNQRKTLKSPIKYK